VIKPSSLLVLVALGAAGWFFFQKFEIVGLDQVSLVRRDALSDGRRSRKQASAETIRIASFNIQTFGPQKAGKEHVLLLIAEIIRQFDIVAVQEVRSKSPKPLEALLAQINAEGRRYSLVVGPREGRTDSKEQYVYFFDQETIEVDRAASYRVEDPDDLLHRPPLVAWFRTRGPPPDQAFTFSLVNVHTDPDLVDDELEALDDVFFSVRSDGRGEDDVIMLGDFNAAADRMDSFRRVAGMTFAVTEGATNTQGTKQYDNLIFQMPATVEYVQHGGVLDFLRQHNLTIEQALSISDHLPVWAEFSIFEGGQPSPVVARAAAKARVR